MRWNCISQLHMHLQETSPDNQTTVGNPCNPSAHQRSAWPGISITNLSPWRRKNSDSIRVTKNNLCCCLANIRATSRHRLPRWRVCVCVYVKCVYVYVADTYVYNMHAGRWIYCQINNKAYIHVHMHVHRRGQSLNNTHTYTRQLPCRRGRRWRDCPPRGPP